MAKSATSAINRVLNMKRKNKGDQVEYKSLAFEVKTDGDETNIIEGYAATFGGEPDSWGDVIQKGAFAKTLKEQKTFVFLWQHDWTEPIGRIIEAKEDATGLFIRVKISDTTRGKDTMIMVKDKTIDKMSIGYRTIKDSYDRESGIRTLLEVKLMEVSVVTFPANERAVVTSAKNFSDDIEKSFKEDISQFVEDALEDIKAGNELPEEKKAAIQEAIQELEDANKSLKTLLDPVHDSEGGTGAGDQKQDEYQPDPDLAALINEFKNEAKKSNPA